MSSTAKPRILLIDDAKVFRRMVRKSLGEDTFEFSEAGDCDEAIALLKGAPRMDVIILDHHMPGHTGLKFMELTAALPERAGVPVIMVTSARTESLMEQGRKLGIALWLTKPIAPSDLKDAVANVLKTPGKR